jgi:predicted DNA-binding transcriptional regulator AlpA
MPPANRPGTPEEVAEYLQRSEKTLRNWRATGTGPPYIKVAGGGVRYRWPDVEKWLSGQRIDPAAAALRI